MGTLYMDEVKILCSSSVVGFTCSSNRDEYEWAQDSFRTIAIWNSEGQSC